MAAASWTCLLLPLASAVLITLGGTRISRRAAGYISKVLASAVANAANNHELDPNRLKLIECRVDEGPRMKRVQPRAQGRAYRIPGWELNLRTRRLIATTGTLQPACRSRRSTSKPSMPGKCMSSKTAS